MVTEKITMVAVMNTVPKEPRLCWNTLRARVALVAPEVHSPVISTLRAVMVHTMKVDVYKRQHIFYLADEKSETYRCQYCEEKYSEFK